MNFKKFKLHLFYIRKAFFQYRRGFTYLFRRYLFASKILKTTLVLEKPINNQDLSIHILTCHRDLTLTVWSLASFYQVMPVLGQLFIHNDGSLNGGDIALLKRFFPSAKLVKANDFLTRYSDKLANFPTLAKFRRQYNNFSFKKIIDPYFVSDKKFILILDSDILWFKPPVDLVAGIKGGGVNSLMQKNNVAIYASLKDGKAVAEKFAWFNAGIIFYNKENFDCQKLSDFFDSLDTTQPKNLHFADQLGHAHCLKNLLPLSEEKYIIGGAITNQVVAKHYTGPKRALFYLEGIDLIKKNLLL